MKKRAVFFLFMAILAGTAGLSAQEYQGPKIEVSGDRFDFGRVVQGTPATHTFEVRNTGKEPLVIERVQPS